MKVEDHLEQILQRWVEAFGQYAQRKADAETAVVRWEWAAGERYSLLPFFFNRFPGRARAMKGPPESPGYYFRYGFDENDRLRIKRFYAYHDQQAQERIERDRARGFERDDLFQTFYSYSADLVEILEYSIPPRIPIMLRRIAYRDGRVTVHTTLKLNGYTPLYSQKGEDPLALYEWLGPNGRFRQVEEYRYDGERLTGIHLYTETPGLGAYESEELFSYDDSGSLAKIERIHAGGVRQTAYQKRRKGQTFQSIRAAATRTLIEAIVAKIRSENVDEPVCCIELSYQDGLEHFPPAILLGFESARRELLASDDPNARYFIFTPALMQRYRFLEIDDPQALEVCSQLEQEIHTAEKWGTARRILREVAAALTRYDWTGIMDTTPDFVAFAIDWEMHSGQLASVLGASASKEQIRDWKRQGWL